MRPFSDLVSKQASSITCSYCGAKADEPCTYTAIVQARKGERSIPLCQYPCTTAAAINTPC